MKELFIGTRRCGKTEYLINKVSEDLDNGLHSIIVCPNRVMCKVIADTARRMEKLIPNPITIDDLVNYNGYHCGTLTDNKKFYFDELQMSLEVLAGRIPIETVVIDVTHSEITFKDNTPRWAEFEYKEPITAKRLAEVFNQEYPNYDIMVAKVAFRWLLNRYTLTEKEAEK